MFLLDQRDSQSVRNAFVYAKLKCLLFRFETPTTNVSIIVSVDVDFTRAFIMFANGCAALKATI